MKTLIGTFISLVVLANLVILSGCGKAIELPAISTIQVPSVDATPTPLPTPVEEARVNPSPTPDVVQITTSNTSGTIDITYYSKTETRAPINGWATKTYTSTGNCTAVNGDTYCWDDGMKTLSWSTLQNHYGPYTYSYFNLSMNLVGWNMSSGNMVADLMPAPRRMTHIIYETLPSVVVQSILTTGTPHTVTCNDDGVGTIDCGSFIIDTNQVPL